MKAIVLCAMLLAGHSAAAPLPLQVLVTFALPDASLQQLARQAAQLQLPLTMRGLHQGSLAATAERSAALLKAVPGASLSIDPEPFRRHVIDRVPAFVLAAAPVDCAAQCGAAPSAVAVGDVTLAYALRRLTRDPDAAVAAAARHYLQRLGELP